MRRDEKARHAVLDGVDEPAHRGRDDRPTVRHRLPRDDAIALAVRRADDHGRPYVVRDELVTRDEAERLGRPCAEGAVAHDHPWDPLGRPDEVEDPLLLGETAHEQRVRRIVRLADGVGNRDPARHHAHPSCAELACGRCERLRRAQHDARPANEAPGGPAHTRRELHVRSPQLEDERLAGLQRREGGRKPVGVDEVGIARRTARCSRVRSQEYRQQERLPRTAPEVPDDAVSVGEPEVPERGGRDDLDVEPGGAKFLHRLAHEHPCDVVRPARVRRREHDDLHSRRKRATMGSAAASVAKT